MKYKHIISEEELKNKFDSILEIDDSYDHDDKYHRLNRNSQANRVHTINIENMDDVTLLLDYLTTFDWHYEPALEIRLKNNISFNMPARGNTDHNLKNGDLMIVQENYIKAIQSFDYYHIKLYSEYMKVIRELSKLKLEIAKAIKTQNTNL